MQNEPHWLIVALIGAMLGLLLPYLARVPRFVWRLRTTEPLEGEWFEYHTTFVGQKQRTSSGVWTVRKGFFNRLVVEFQHETGGTLAYKGYLFEERGHVVVVLKSASHATETVYYRFIDPIASERPIPGLWLSFDREGSICSGAAILSHKSMEESEVTSMFGNFFQRTAKIPALRVNT